MIKNVYENKPYRYFISYDKTGNLWYETGYRKTNYWFFKYGRPIPNYSYDLTFESDVAEEKMITRDILYGTFDCPIVNRRVLDILNTICPDDFQAFPAIIRNSKPKAVPFENRDYHVINITKTVDSIDRKLSDFEPNKDDPKRFSKMKKLVFKEGCMGNNHLARDKFWQHEELMSSTLVKALKKEKVKGISFRRDEEYSR